MARTVESMGELRYRIEILRRRNAKDGAGFPVVTTESVCTCWAAVSDGTYRANEHFSAAVNQIVKTVDFTIRYGVAKKYSVTEGMLVCYAGREYRILQLYCAGHLRDFITLIATDSVVVGKQGRD